MLVNVDPFLPRLFQLLEDALGPVHLLGFAFEFYPTFAGRDFHAERVLQRLQELEVVRIKRLDGAWAIELQRARFGHFGTDPGGGDDTARAGSVKLPFRDLEIAAKRLAESVNKRPVGSFFRRRLDFDDDK